MRKGENVFKRKDGRWEARYIKGREPSGRIRYGFCYGKTCGEAREKAMKCKAALLDNKPLPTSGARRRFAYYCDEWLQARESRIRESTYIKYSTVLEKHIKPRLGDFLPQRITTDAVEKFSEALIEDGLSAKTVCDILTVLHGILKYSAAQFPNTFPDVEIHRPKGARREARVLNPEEQERLMRYLLDKTDSYKFGILLMLLTGMRIGELCALQWGSISVKNRTIRITSTLQRLRDRAADGASRTHIVIGAPKSSTSVRTIPLTGYAAGLCRKYASRNAAAYVLTGTGKYMEPRALQYHIRKCMQACGLVNVHAHTLRHTFATRAVEVGFELKSLSEVLGHANTNITIERYVHSSMELKRANMNKLETMGL